MTLPRLLFCMTLVSIVARPAAADGITLVEGHLGSGTYVTIHLSPEQVVTVRTKRVVVLSPAQKSGLQKAKAPSPTALTVYSRKVAAQGIDSCFEYNIALWATESTIEVPLAFLVDHATAATKASDLENID